MSKQIFFSWQSDTDNRTGRNFLMDVLERVCKNISNDNSVEEAERGIYVDSDTKGTGGRPPIVDTIFKKIDDSLVYVADMTFVAKRVDGRPSPNPNVLIEYGWALKSKTHELVITVMNTAYGDPSEITLPFNMKHMLWPVRYNLPINATPEEKSHVRDILVKELTPILKASIANGKTLSDTDKTELLGVEAKDGPARFRLQGESLGYNNGFGFDNPKEVFLNPGSEMWFHLIPKSLPEVEWTIIDLKEKLSKEKSNLTPLINGFGGTSTLIAEDGLGVYITAKEDNESSRENTKGVCFLFTSGEIWSIDTALLAHSSKNLYQHEIEKAYTVSLKNYSNFLSSLNIKGPYIWVAGMRGIKGRSLRYSPPPNKVWIGDYGPTCMTDFIEVRGEYDSENQTEIESLIPFFNKIFEKCAVARPDYLQQK